MLIPYATNRIGLGDFVNLIQNCDFMTLVLDLTASLIWIEHWKIAVMKRFWHCDDSLKWMGFDSKIVIRNGIDITESNFRMCSYIFKQIIFKYVQYVPAHWAHGEGVLEIFACV